MDDRNELTPASTPADLALTFELLNAVECNQLVLHYQPVIDLRSGVAESFEALVRWRHPRLGVLAPGDFLHLARSPGVARRITDWVLDRALAECADWRGQGRQAGVAVNIGPELLSDDWLVALLGRKLLAHRIEASALTIEVTEAGWPPDPRRAYAVLAVVRALGVRISLDDFGTGDSSLARLRRVEFDELKIDRSFVSGAAASDADREIVAFSSGLARALGMRVVAEGVEEEADLALITEMGLDAAQGFFLGRPEAVGVAGGI